jgi:hypothetical protein
MLIAAWTLVAIAVALTVPGGIQVYSRRRSLLNQADMEDVDRFGAQREALEEQCLAREIEMLTDGEERTVQ